MDEIQALVQGFGVALSLKNLLFMFTGIILGVIIVAAVTVDQFRQSRTAQS